MQEMSARPATYKKSQQYFVEKNKFTYRPHLNTFLDVWGVPQQGKKGIWHKTDCRNVLSAFLLEFQ